MLVIARRLFFYLVTATVAISLDFLIPRMIPGNPVDAILSHMQGVTITPAIIHALDLQFGVKTSASLWGQYVHYWNDVLHGNLGVSYVNQQPVAGQLWTALKNTIPMVTAGTLLSIIVGVFTGVLAAWRRGSIADHISTNTAVFAYAFPTQWIGLMLLIWLARYLRFG